jgi:hypothetical protein
MDLPETSTAEGASSHVDLAALSDFGCLDHVLSYLSVGELLQVALVCRLLHNAVNRSLARVSYVFRSHLVPGTVCGNRPGSACLLRKLLCLCFIASCLPYQDVNWSLCPLHYTDLAAEGSALRNFLCVWHGQIGLRLFLCCSSSRV